MKRRLLIAAIFLLAGAVVNVAVAWRCAAWSKTIGHPAEQVIFDSPLAELGEISVAPAFSGFGLRMDLVHSQALNYHVDLSISCGWPLLSMRQPTWRHFSVMRPPPDPQTYSKVVGFLRSLPDGRDPDPQLASFFGSSEEYSEAAAFMSWLGTCFEKASVQAMATPRRMLLTRPVWPGFAINTGFYAAVLWLLICGPFALRRVVRARRGLCPKCAYPMGGSAVCSECGKAIPHSTVA